MKYNLLATSVMVLIATMLGISNGWSYLSASGTKLKSQYAKELQSLERDLERVMPTPDQRKKSAYLKSREAESAAIADLKEAQKRQAKYGSAKALVGHAKGKWIGGAEKQIAQAKEKLKNAGNDAQRDAAKEELAKAEKGKQEGLEALEERQALLDEAKSDKPKADRALKDAKEALVNAKTRTMEATENLGLNALLSSDKLDGRLAKYVVIKEATPDALAAFGEQGREQEKFLDQILSNDELLVQMAVADGAKNGKYGKAIQIYYDIQKASDKAVEGTLQRLAMAISLEHAVPITQRNAVAATDAPFTVDPVKRYLQFEKAFLDKQLDPAFANLSVWDYRMVVDGTEPDEIIVWGRKMLRNYSPDHITGDDYRWRYVSLVRSDIPYGSQDVKYDKDELQFFQNILMNGGVCGRRAFIGRFILRAFGIPTTARPQRGHAALAHWTPQGWVICLGAGWGNGWTKTLYKADLDFLATTQARATGRHYLQVKRAHWIGDVMGEKQAYGFISSDKPEFWNGVALYMQRALIEAAKTKTLDAVGEDIAEASDSREKIEIVPRNITEEDRKIHVDDGVITIPAAATSEPTSSNRKITFMPSTLGGKQLHYSRSAGGQEFEYTFRAPDHGKYALTARVVTPSWKQSLVGTINGDDQPIAIPLPHTVGLWETTQPIAVELKNGRNVLRLTRHSEGSAKGITIKDFKLTPWEDHLKTPTEESTEAEDRGMSPSYRRLLSLSLLRGLTDIDTDGALKPLPMDLSVTRLKVNLVEAKGSGILVFRAIRGGKLVPIALEDLALKDHALLARFVARLRPDDPTANARAGVYMEFLGNAPVALGYKRKAGREAVEKFEAMLGNSAK
jgi:hypothetical protein